MAYNIGTILRIDGKRYYISGYVEYQSLNEKSRWTEYKMRELSTHQEWWLSYDDYNNEYSLAQVKSNGNSQFLADTDGFHEVDSGTARAVASRGDVDVDPGESFNFIEYEDITEEKIRSLEIWEDETEISDGYYIDKEEITVESQGSTSYSRTPSSGGAGTFAKLAAFIVCVGAILSGFTGFIAKEESTRMSRYIKTSTDYAYKTSITSPLNDKQKADVYTTSLSVDEAAQNIIKGIDGKTESVQQNTDDNDKSIAILTQKEYSLIYTDSEEGGTLVQICPRTYAYSDSSAPYHSSSSTHRYYRRYYYSRAYYHDRYKYKKYTDSYSDYSDTPVSSNSNDKYSTYSNSVRQSSLAARSSSGGGTSSGK